MPLYALLLLVLLVSGLVLAASVRAFYSPWARGFRVHQQLQRKLRGLRLYKSVLLNSALSASMVFLVALGLSDVLFYERSTSMLRPVLEVIGILALYDLLYYLMHRHLFHGWDWLKRVHAVHHTGKHPIGIESLYIHPIETFMGVGLLLICTFVVGPVHVYAFGAAFFAYSVLNIGIHSGLDIPIFPLNLLGYMVKKHDRHHDSMRAGNYASITPIPDLLFGTNE